MHLAEQDCVALLGSETGKLVAAVGKSGLEKGVKAGNIIKAAAKTLDGFDDIHLNPTTLHRKLTGFYPLR